MADFPAVVRERRDADAQARAKVDAAYAAWHAAGRPFEDDHPAWAAVREAESAVESIIGPRIKALRAAGLSPWSAWVLAVSGFATLDEVRAAGPEAWRAAGLGKAAVNSVARACGLPASEGRKVVTCPHCGGEFTPTEWHWPRRDQR